MGKEMKFEFISKETIKPSSPTPQHLRTFKLSFMDQLAAPIYVPVLFFYPIEPTLDNLSNQKHHVEVADKTQRLKTSLSETLTHFYPLAGRVKDNAVIECNDAGVEFSEAQVHGFLSDILEQPDTDSMSQFVPAETESLEAATGPLLKVQVNFFECGGLAIGASFSHKISDASTINTFIKAWSAAALGCMTEGMLPKYVFGSLYPSVDFPIVLPPTETRNSECVIIRFVFEGSKIEKLRAKVESTKVEKPTRVEAVSALLWKCASTASRSNLGLKIRPTFLSQFVNIRKRFAPPLPENSVGNFLGHFIAKAPEKGENETLELQSLVVQQREALEEFSKVQVKKLQDGNAFSVVCEALKDAEIAHNEETDFYCFTSWCRFSFYDADFGWGTPKWVSVASVRIKNVFVLVDTRDGKGIEAWLMLSKEDMALLESNQELLEFASLNPSVV